MAVNFQKCRFVTQDSYAAGLHTLYKAMQQLAPFAAGQRHAVIMITKAGVRTEPALDIAEQGDYLLSVSAVNIICYVITGQYHYIDIEHINPLDTTMQICTADSFAELLDENEHELTGLEKALIGETDDYELTVYLDMIEKGCVCDKAYYGVMDYCTGEELPSEGYYESKEQAIHKFYDLATDEIEYEPWEEMSDAELEDWYSTIKDCL